MISSSMASRPNPIPTAKDAAEKAASELVRVSHWGQSSFINLPMIFPSGSSACVRVVLSGGKFHVDDVGFAYRELAAIGAERSFPKVAARFGQSEDLVIGKRTLAVTVPEEGLVRAICDVGMASHAVAADVYERLADEGASEIEDYLRERLETIFQGARIESEEEIVGASTHPWKVSAAVHSESGLIVFQAVGNHPYSVYKASTAFHDLNELPTPPRCVSVVKDLEAMGVNLNVLAQAGRVIQSDQSDAVYLEAAA
jgi:hypothetical protein